MCKANTRSPLLPNQFNLRDRAQKLVRIKGAEGRVMMRGVIMPSPLRRGTARALRIAAQPRRQAARASKGAVLAEASRYPVDTWSERKRKGGDQPKLLK